MNSSDLDCQRIFIGSDNRGVSLRSAELVDNPAGVTFGQTILRPNAFNSLPAPLRAHGKTVSEAKELELQGWLYPRHLAGRHFGLIVHGDSAGVGTLRRSLSDWLTDMRLISAGSMAECDGYVGYMKPYATSHEDLDSDTAFQEEVRNAARALGAAVRLARAGRLDNPAEGLTDPVPK